MRHLVVVHLFLFNPKAARFIEPILGAKTNGFGWQHRLMYVTALLALSRPERRCKRPAAKLGLKRQLELELELELEL